MITIIQVRTQALQSQQFDFLFVSSIKQNLPYCNGDHFWRVIVIPVCHTFKVLIMNKNEALFLTPLVRMTCDFIFIEFHLIEATMMFNLKVIVKNGRPASKILFVLDGKRRNKNKSRLELRSKIDTWKLVEQVMMKPSSWTEILLNRYYK